MSAAANEMASQPPSSTVRPDGYTGLNARPRFGLTPEPWLPTNARLKFRHRLLRPGGVAAIMLLGACAVMAQNHGGPAGCENAARADAGV